MLRYIRLLTTFIAGYLIFRGLDRWFDPRPRAELKVSPDPYFVGSYHKIKVSLRNVSFDDLDFQVVEGAPGGYISRCRDAEFDSSSPEIMMCFGYRPGTYHVEVRRISDNTVLSTVEFHVDTSWSDEKHGPGLSFTGICENLAYFPAWGGGPSTPQNLNVVPATGTRRIALVLIDFANARYPTAAATLTAIRDRWVNETITGINNAGRLESARLDYREASYNNYDLSASIFGPVNFTNNWSDNFESDGAPKATFWQAAVTACDGTLNYNDFDNLIFISEAWTDTAGAVMNAWPYGGAGAFSTAEGNKNLGVISMPREWGAGFRADRTVRSTIIHELGHSLGLGDQYKPEAGRNTGNWEPMASENNLPHFSLVHRMMLGWVPAGWLKAYNFANGGGVVNETVVLSPIEVGAPTGANRAGIEIRVADGWNYYVEYRSGQSTHIGDRAMDTANAVLVTDVDSTPGDAPISRPTILLVAKDIDGDGSVLINGLDYEETDTTDPTFPTDFKLSVSGITTAKADVKVEYGVNSRPDPAIRPWPASAERQWQSPDIEVQNTRNLADPANWFNVPWAGNPNTVIARVKNNGNLAAPQVRVEFYVKNYNVGGAPEVPLGADTRDIPALGTVDFSTSWNPPAGGHFCIVVKIPGYLTPPPAPVLEMSIFNNLAQTNYDRFISATASPATREITMVEVGNPYDEPTRIFIRPGQTNPLYRTYVEHTSLYLAPGETKKIKLMFEFDPDIIYRLPVSLGKDSTVHPQNERLVREIRKKFDKVPNRVGVVGYVDDPTEEHPHTPSRLSGVDAEIVTGRATHFERFDKRGRVVSGRVVASDNKIGVDSGKVILLKQLRGEDEKGRIDVVIALDAAGSFHHELRDDDDRLQSIQAYYLPGPDLGDCYSKFLK